jgi:dephospho-CoA kinase
MRTVTILGGEPASGKSTLMRRFIQETGEWTSLEPKKTLQALYNKNLDSYIFGKYEEGVLFAGTDRLSMSVQPIACSFIEETKSNIFIEGDRLFNMKFIRYVMNMSETRIIIVHVKADNEIMKTRHKYRNDTQDEKFLKSRQTKVDNIVTSADLREIVVCMENNNISEQTKIIELMKQTIKMEHEEYEIFKKNNKSSAAVSLSDFF